MSCPSQRPPFANLSPPTTYYHTCLRIEVRLTPFPTTVQPVMKFGVIYKEVVPVWVSLLKLQENTFSLNCCGIWS